VGTGNQHKSGFGAQDAVLEVGELFATLEADGCFVLFHSFSSLVNEMAKYASCPRTVSARGMGLELFGFRFGWWCLTETKLGIDLRMP
jgi:hypothetical protein